ncbi:unnamed protein product, partial [Porites evermanni]
ATKCEQLSSQASQNGGLLGSFVPKCNADGSFSSEQCWPSPGFCWCVDKFGEEIPGTKVRGKADCSKTSTFACFFFLLCVFVFCKTTATKCEQLSSQASQNGGLLGSFVPKCNTDGSFSSEQCWSSTGFCWCVDKFGEEIPGTKVRGKADCTNKAGNYEKRVACEYSRFSFNSTPLLLQATTDWLPYSGTYNRQTKLKLEKDYSSIVITVYKSKVKISNDI